MKNFSQFISEARVSNASKKAHQLGLFGDGHGYWIDRQGNRIGKTVKGEFVAFEKKKPAPVAKEKKEAPQPEVAPIARDDGQELEPVAQPQIDAQQRAQRPVEAPPSGETPEGVAVLVFGRFNPPTIGHEKLLDKAANIANEMQGDMLVYPSRTTDPRKNPLDAKVKIAYMKRMFPEYREAIVNDPNVTTIFDALSKVQEMGVSDVILVVGQDRVNEFANLANKYNGKYYEFNNIEVKTAGNRDPDSDGPAGMSASKARKFASEDNFKGFRECIPMSLSDDETEDLFRDVQRGMNIRPYQKSLHRESVELWEIAPKLDPHMLRDEYKKNNLFNVGCLVESLNTGLKGRIIRRGTNYVICLANEGFVFKSWISDVKELSK